MSSLTQHYTRRKLGISLTPLIDVVFILLIFFMLASSFAKHKSLELTLPPNGVAKSNPSQNIEEKNHLKILGADKIELDKQTYLVLELPFLLEDKRGNRLIIEVGEDAVAQDMVTIMDLVTKLNLEKVSLLPYKKEEDRP